LLARLYWMPFAGCCEMSTSSLTLYMITQENMIISWYLHSGRLVDFQLENTFNIEIHWWLINVCMN
jgi:hypothetical protein